MIYAGFFRRAMALIIDVLIVLIPTLFIFGPILGALSLQVVGADDAPGLSAPQGAILGATILSWQIVTTLLLWLYFAWLESGKHQATLGKRLLGIKVVGIDGARIGFGRASGRFFSKLLSHLLLDIGFIMAAFTNRKRALHDMIAETYVVKKDCEPGQELPPTPSHPVLLLVVIALWVLLILGGALFSAQASQTPTQVAARKAAISLYNLSQRAAQLEQPLRQEGVSYFSTPEGYHAVVTDPASGNKFTLFLQRGTLKACCQAFPFGDCASTGLDACNAN